MGFESLLVGCKCVCFGMPFYIGWGLTNDKYKNQRRKRKLSLFEFAAGTLIIYPRYISPKMKKSCELEVTFDEMLELQSRYFEVFWYSALINSKTFVLRKVRRVIEFMLQLIGKK